jgi:hypothetical protein
MIRDPVRDTGVTWSVGRLWPTLPFLPPCFSTFCGNELGVDALDELQQDPPKF